MPKWSDVFGNNKVSASNGGSNSLVKERPQELLRRALRSYLKSVVFRAPLGGRVAMPLKVPSPWSAHVAGVERFSDQNQEEAEMGIEGLLPNCGWSQSIRDDIIKVLDVSQRQNGQISCQLIPSDPDGD